MVKRNYLPFQSAVNEREAELPHQYVERSVREIEDSVPADHYTRKNSADPMIEILGVHGQHAARFQRAHKLLERTQWVPQDSVAAPDSNHIILFAAKPAILENVGKKRKPIGLAAVGGEIDVRFNTSDIESNLSSCEPKKPRSASYVQKPSATDAGDIDDPPHPPAALFDTDSVVSNIVHIGSGRTGTFTPKIVLAAVERSDRGVSEARVLEHQGAIRAPVPDQAGSIEIERMRSNDSCAVA